MARDKRTRFSQVFKMPTRKTNIRDRLIFYTLKLTIHLNFRNQRLVKIEKDRHMNESTPMRTARIIIKFNDMTNRLPQCSLRYSSDTKKPGMPRRRIEATTTFDG
ncbi:hypothetical protein V6Z12_D10G123200 [Gossypium hirsutum]